MSNVLERSFPARLDAHYLLRVPEAVDAHTPLVVALHGFGENPETMLSLTEKMFDQRVAIAALQGPNQFFLGADLGKVGYGWITSRRPAHSIRLHRDMVLHVLEEVGREFAIPPERRLLVGFSQAVALNYRFAATCPDAVCGVVGVCGGVPSDWEDPSHHPVNAALLHIAGREDTFYPPDITGHYLERLRLRAADVEFHMLDGGHRMPSAGNLIVGRWLGRILG
jgi:predicted esterase